MSKQIKVREQDRESKASRGGGEDHGGEDQSGGEDQRVGRLQRALCGCKESDAEGGCCGTVVLVV